MRGTEFWGGPINAKYGVLLLEGEVTVSNQAGSVTLSAPGQGTDIASRLPSEESLDTMSLEQSTEQIKLAMITCARVASLEANPLARLLRGDEIKALAERCELIKARQDSLGGP